LIGFHAMSGDLRPGMSLHRHLSRLGSLLSCGAPMGLTCA
jgi:hypothetical protein